MLAKLDHIHSKLLYRIEELEKLQAKHSKQLDHHSKQLDHLSKEGEHQGKRLRRHSEELACLNKKVRTEDEEKETYSEFWDKKGINLCGPEHEIFMQIFLRCLVCKRYKKSNSVCVHTHRHIGAKLLAGGGGLSFFCPKTLAQNVFPPLPPPLLDDECFRK